MPTQHSLPSTPTPPSLSLASSPTWPPPSLLPTDSLPRLPPTPQARGHHSCTLRCTVSPDSVTSSPTPMWPSSSPSRPTPPSTTSRDASYPLHMNNSKLPSSRTSVFVTVPNSSPLLVTLTPSPPRPPLPPSSSPTPSSASPPHEGFCSLSITPLPPSPAPGAPNPWIP